MNSSLDERLYAHASAMSIDLDKRHEYEVALKVRQQTVSDLEHLLELSKTLDAIALTQLVLKLRTALKERREIKDKLDLICYARKTCQAKAIMNYIKSRKARKYTPRVLSEIGILGGETA